MMTFSPLIILVPFFVYLAVHFFLALINLKHLFRIGALTFTSFVFTSIFVVYTLLILGSTWAIVGDLDWSKPVSFDISRINFSTDAF